MPDYKSIRVEVGDGRTDIYLNRPPFNILNIEMMNEISVALRLISSDKNLKVLSFCSDLNVFSYGIDATEHTSMKVKDVIGAFRKLFERLWEIKAITLAVVNGNALGGGCELAVGCDLVVASDQSRFGQPEIKNGVFPPMATVMFPKLIGRNRAFEWLLGGDTQSAEVAERIGLVNQVFDVDEFDKKVEEYIGKFTSYSASTIVLAKQAIDKCMDRPARDGMTYVDVIYVNKLMRTADANEGLKAFIEKRDPVWTNQ